METVETLPWKLLHLRFGSYLRELNVGVFLESSGFVEASKGFPNSICYQSVGRENSEVWSSSWLQVTGTLLLKLVVGSYWNSVLDTSAKEICEKLDQEKTTAK